MSETERARVGIALDLVRDALASFVDDAMTAAHDADWHERVADEDAKRRTSGRRLPVAKGDLAVMLKVIQYERIAPWWAPGTFVDPRIRSYSSEVLTLRNLYSHGDECIGEHSRLVDTASRLLQLLALPVPPSLEAASNAAESDLVMAPEPTVEGDRFDRELARLSDQGKRLMEILARAEQIRQELLASARQKYRFETDQPDTEGFAEHAVLTYGPELLDMFTETFRLDTGEGQPDPRLVHVLALAARSSLAAPLLARLVMTAAMKRDLEDTGADGDRTLRKARLRRMTETVAAMEGLNALHADGLAGWREVVRLADEVSDSDEIPTLMIVIGNHAILEAGDISDEESLRVVRESLVRVRMLAGISPGSSYETLLVGLLRSEGKLCNDLGRSDEATKAFARADEIIDRYPAADPDLR